MDYDLFEHRHRFAAWASARASQRGLTGVAILREALEASGIVQFVRLRRNLKTGAQAFDRLHDNWCSSIRTALRRRGVMRATHGRAAKLVAVYLKAMVIIGPDADSSLARVAHPPVDRILLRNLTGAERGAHQLSRWRRTAWTELDQPAYHALIADLRDFLPHGEPFWKIEQYWTIT